MGEKAILKQYNRLKIRQQRERGKGFGHTYSGCGSSFTSVD